MYQHPTTKTGEPDATQKQHHLRGLIDSHFHCLEMQAKGIDVGAVLAELHRCGFAGGMDIGVRVDDLANRIPLLERWPDIRLAAGIGPWGAQGSDPIDAIMARFTTHIQGLHFHCIGEIGLDDHWGYGTRARQESLFCAQMELADSLKLPVAIHSRDADDRMGQVLASKSCPCRGILHCFSSTIGLARIALDANLMISFAGPITYKKNQELRDVLRYVPSDRLLLETDSPYLSPEPFRGQLNTPLRMETIYQAAATVRSAGLEELATSVRTNFESLFHAP